MFPCLHSHLDSTQRTDWKKKSRQNLLSQTICIWIEKNLSYEHTFLASLALALAFVWLFRRRWAWLVLTMRTVFEINLALPLPFWFGWFGCSWFGCWFGCWFCCRCRSVRRNCWTCRLLFIMWITSADIPLPATLQFRHVKYRALGWYFGLVISRCQMLHSIDVRCSLTNNTS